MRNDIWGIVRSKVPEGAILPWWALVARAVLFPIDSFYWRMRKTRGYQFENDTWLIEGVTYSGVMLRNFSRAQGEVFRVKRNGDVITVEKLCECWRTK